jgi:hypothetical protein
MKDEYFIKKSNLEHIQIVVYPGQINLVNKHRSGVLSLERPSSKIIDPRMPPESPISEQSVSAVLGIFDEEDLRFLVCAKEVSQFGEIEGSPLYLVESVVSVEVTKFEQRPALLANIEKVLEKGFFFGLGRDLSRRAEALEKALPSKSFSWGGKLR